MFGEPRARRERDKDDAKVVVLCQRLGVLAVLPLRLPVKLLQFPREIEFQKGSSRRRRVWSSVLVVVLVGA
jgi:hypothetical protein